jgi:hypothetical protein
MTRTTARFHRMTSGQEGSTHSSCPRTVPIRMKLKRRLLGLAMVLPLAWLISIVAPTCQRGAIKGAGGGAGLGSEVLNNLATLGLFVSVPLAITGLVYLFGSSKRADTDAD